MEQWEDLKGSQLYPAGTEGELAVGYYREREDLPDLFPASDRSEADAMFAEFLGSDLPVRVLLEDGPHAGRRSPVLFIVRCAGGTNWFIIKETEGAKQEVPSGRLDLPDLKCDFSLKSLL